MLLVSSPDSRLGNFDAGGFARTVMMSSAVYVRKELFFTSVKLICFEKNTTVSVLYSAIVVEM